MFVGYIYRFYNKITHKYYIGQTIRSMNLRLAEHLKSSEKPSRNYFHNALYKYGIENFEMDVIYTVSRESKKELIDVLNFLEILEIERHDSMNNGYNLNSGGKRYVLSDRLKKILSESHKGIKFSEEHRLHLSQANVGNKKLIDSLKGRKVSNETREKISESVKKSYTEEHKQKTSLANKGKVVSDEMREKLKLVNLGKKHSDETKKKLSEITKKHLEDPEYRKKLSEGAKKNWQLRKQNKPKEVLL